MATMTHMDTPIRKGNRTFPYFSAISILLCALLIIALGYKPFRELLVRLEYWTSDFRMVFLSDRTQVPHPKIVVVTFNNETFGGQPRTPIPRDFHADVIAAIDSMHPKAIGLDFYFLKEQSTEADQKFKRALQQAKTEVVVGAVDESATLFEPRQFEYQEKFLNEIGRKTGYINLMFDTGSVVRFTQPPAEGSKYRTSFAYQLALIGGAAPAPIALDSNSIRIAWLVGPNFDVRPFVNIPAHKVLAAQRETATSDVARAIKDSIVLTGIDFPYMDEHETPLTAWTGYPMKGMIIHANVIAQMLDGRYFYELTPFSRMVFLLGLGIMGLILSWLFWRRTVDVSGIGFATAGLVLVDALNFAVFRTALPLVFALYVWFAAVTFGHHAKTLIWWMRQLPAKP
jgi:adenylate cyclase